MIDNQNNPNREPESVDPRVAHLGERVLKIPDVYAKYRIDPQYTYDHSKAVDQIQSDAVEAAHFERLAVPERSPESQE